MDRLPLGVILQRDENIGGLKKGYFASHFSRAKDEEKSISMKSAIVNEL